MKINNRTLKRRFFVWRCRHCIFGNRYNDCYDDDCNLIVWLKIKWRYRKEKGSEK